MLPAIRVDNLSKCYRLNEVEKGGHTLTETIMEAVSSPWRALRNAFGAVHGDGAGRSGPPDIFWALRDVSFEVYPGDVLAIIGPNGAGKSTLFKIISQITKPTSGLVEVRGRLGSLLEVGTGFHPELTGRENVFLNGAILGMTRREVERKFDEIVAFAEIDQFIDMPVKRYSSGMYMRLAFSVAAYLEPEILLLDEVMAVGDAEFQEKAQRRIRDLTSQGITTLMISHSPVDVELLAKRCLYIRSGALEFDGPPAEALELYSSHMHQEINAGEPAEPALDGVAEAAPFPREEMVMPSKQNSEAPPYQVNGAESPAAPAEPSPGEAPPDLPAHAILAIEAQNPLGHHEITQGDDLQVWIHYRTSLVGVAIPIQVSIWTERDVIVTVADSWHQEPPASGAAAVALCTFRAPPLAPGTYLVRALMFHPHEEGVALAAFGLEGDERTCAFVVRAPGQADGYVPPADSGLLAIPFEWSRPAEESPPPAALELAEAGSPAPPTVNLSIHSGQAVRIAFHFTGQDEVPVAVSLNTPDGQPLAALPPPKEEGGTMKDESNQVSDSSFRLPPSAFPGAEPLAPEALAGLRREWVAKEPNSIVGFLQYALRITDGWTAYTLYKDIFCQRIYHFRCPNPDPVIVDGGSQLGMPILYFKHVYPRARILGFEANPDLFHLLQENVKRNGLTDVTLIHAALGGQAGTRAFAANRSEKAGPAADESQILVQVRPLSDFLREPVDFLKLSLGGDELAVLRELEAADKWGLIRELVIHYTSRAGEEQELGEVLTLLARQGFRYLVHDLDAETNLATKPPFRIGPTTTWNCLVYATRLCETRPPGSASGDT